METIKEIQALIENKEGLKTSIKKHKSGSMKGYVTIQIKKVSGIFVEMSHGLSKEISVKYAKPEPTPTFANKYQVSLYVGMVAIWNS